MSPTASMTASMTILELRRRADVSHWFKTSLETALQRDCVQAAMEADMLAKILRARCEEIIDASNRVIEAKQEQGAVRL